MCDVPVFYATSEGQTRRIAERIASTLREQGLSSEAFDLSNRKTKPDWLSARAVVIGGSIHAGSHQRAVREFVERELRHVAARPSAFFSVSLSAGSRNPAEVDAARSLAVGFVRAAGWEPRHLACFAGTLAYTKYGLLKRLAMQYIARAEGAPTDPSRDYEFTNWNAVRQFALDVSQDVLGGRARETPAASVA